MKRHSDERHTEIKNFKKTVVARREVVRVKRQHQKPERLYHNGPGPINDSMSKRCLDLRENRVGSLDGRLGHSRHYFRATMTKEYSRYFRRPNLRSTSVGSLRFQDLLAAVKFW